MDYHDKAIKSMLDNLGLITSSSQSTNMNLRPMYGCPFNNEEEPKDSEKISRNKYEVFRKNHFEVYLSHHEKHTLYDELRLATYSMDLNLFSGNIVFKVYATHDVLKIISKFVPNQKFDLRYLLYNPDASAIFTAYDDVAILKDITFNSKYEIDKTKDNSGEIVTLTFKSKDMVM